MFPDADRSSSLNSGLLERFLECWVQGKLFKLAGGKLGLKLCISASKLIGDRRALRPFGLLEDLGLPCGDEPREDTESGDMEEVPGGESDAD